MQCPGSACKLADHLQGFRTLSFSLPIIPGQTRDVITQNPGSGGREKNEYGTLCNDQVHTLQTTDRSFAKMANEDP